MLEPVIHIALDRSEMFLSDQVSVLYRQESAIEDALAHDRSVSGMYPYRDEIFYASFLTPIIIELGLLLHANRQGIQKFCRPNRQPDEESLIPSSPAPDRARQALRVATAGGVAVTIAVTGVWLNHIGAWQKAEDWAQHALHGATLDAYHEIPVGQAYIRQAPEAAVYGFYSTVSAAHSVQAWRGWGKSRIRVVSHIYAAAVCMGMMGVMAGGIIETRWHHMSFGQLFLLPDLRALNTCGHLLVADSAAYWFDPERRGWDFSDVFRRHIVLYVMEIALLSLWQIGSSRYHSREQSAPIEVRMEPLDLESSDELQEKDADQ